jgi:hypothetical protein
VRCLRTSEESKLKITGNACTYYLEPAGARPGPHHLTARAWFAPFALVNGGVLELTPILGLPVVAVRYGLTTSCSHRSWAA